MKRRTSYVAQALGFGCLIIFLLAYLFPIIWQISTSFKYKVDAVAIPPKWFARPTIENYKEVLFNYNLKAYLRNSVLIAFGSTFLALLLGSMAAYGLTRFNFRRRKDLAFWILSNRMAPPVAVIIPFYYMWRSLGLYDTYLGLILVYQTFNLPFAVWLLRDFFREIPMELDEAAMVDGASRWEVFRKVILPLGAPGLVATAIFCLIMSWNEFFFSLILTGLNAKTLPVATTAFVSDMGVQWGELTAMATVIVVPILIFTMIVQRYLVRGLTLGALKE